MARKVSTKGKCYICKKELGKGAMKTHLRKCKNQDEGDTEYLRLKVEGYYDKDFWIYLQVKSSATLRELDAFLRRIWLECCDHLSEFNIGGVGFESHGRGVSSMIRFKLKDVLSEGDVFTHEYDFGSTTTLKLEVVEVYHGVDGADDVILLARNNMKEYACGKCGEKAEYVGVDYDSDEYMAFCTECVDEYCCDSYCASEITNSPRMGVCGYAGEYDEYQLD